jgi:hypothetical protein
MGTRSSYLIQDKSGKKQRKIANVYFQYDGYPEGHPSDVCGWLTQSKVVNGFGEKSELIFNGAGCFAAQFVAKFKDKTGNVYLESIESYGHCGEDYLYEINFLDNYEIEFVATKDHFDSDTKDFIWTEIFRGHPKDFYERYEIKVG